ncbi:MAG TPA: hypothetical protein VF549_01390 [Solirubrobacteraceae bacterium]|jgi:hypothetical protein
MLKSLPLAVAALLVAAAPAGAATRHAAALGSGGACTQAAPCSFETSIEQAAAGDEVVVAPGTYDVGDAVDASSLLSLDVHGVAGAPRPSVHIAAPDNAKSLSLGALATVRHLELVIASAGNVGLQTGGGLTAEDIVIDARAANSLALAVLATGTLSTVVRDVTLNASHEGLYLHDANAELRDLTVAAHAPSSYGLLAVNSTGNARTVTVRDAIVAANGTDLYVEGVDMAVDIDFSEWANQSSYMGTTLVSGAHNVSAPPAFVSSGDLHQAPGAPSIDRGAPATFTLPFDIDGDERPLGGARDIGSDEFRPLPPAPAGETGTADPPPPPPAPSEPVNPTPPTPLAPPAGGPPGLPAQPVAASRCVVPRLEGLSKRRARARLRTARCRLGRVRGHGRRVRRQTRRAGRSLSAGARVGVTLR